jgi:uncharacterized protein (TIGR03437 family)
MKVPPLAGLVLGMAGFVLSLTAQTSTASSLVLKETRYEVQAGQAIHLQVSAATHDFLKAASERRLTLHGPSDRGLVAGLNAAGDAILLAASLSAKPGDYGVDLTALGTGGDTRTGTFEVHVVSAPAVSTTAAQPPVIMLNGWTPGATSCFVASGASDTFGSLATQLINNGVPVAFFFDNCAECPNCTIENLGNALNQAIAGIQYTNGTQVPQIDLIAYDMGGLIARAYLSGIQPNGALNSPINPRIRKLIEIAVPNFGSYLAAQFQNLQTIEMIPGSPFLWSLARWNQGQDDLHGVDAIAIAGNAGILPGTPNPSDGAVSVTSASLGFATGYAQTHTRILPYCHTSNNPAVQCNYPAIANVDAAPYTGQIILSFLASTNTWTTIGTAPSQDTYLSQLGGILFGLVTASNLVVGDVNQVTFGGNVSFIPGTPSNEFYYVEYARGTGTLLASSSSLGQFNCGTYTAIPGKYSTVRCKVLPTISAVTPLVTSVTGQVVASGTTITIAGSGFGTRCNGCQVVAYPNAATTAAGATLTITTWTNTSITAPLPSTFQGLYQLVVTAATGSDSTNIVAQPVSTPTINAGGIVNGASFAATALAPGSIASAFGTSFAATAATDTVVPLPVTLGTTNTQVMVNGTAAPLFYVSPTQVNFQVPFVPAASTTFQVISSGVSGPLLNATVAAAAPGIFSTASSGIGQGAVLNQDSSANSTSNPASQGSVVQIYCTGLGAVTPTLTAGSPGATSAPFNNTVVTPTVMIGGTSVVPQFSAMAPGFVGLYQVNAQVPMGVTGSAVTLQVSAGGQTSNTVTIAVQ